MDLPKNIKALCVVILPLPAQGHLNQLLHLARHLSDRSIPVHYVGSPAHNRQARDRSSVATSSDFLHFHDFPLPPYPTPPPNPNSPTKFPTHLQPLFNSSLHLSSPLSSLLSSLSYVSRRVVLIHDSAMSFAASVAAPFPSVETYAFHSVSAFTNLFFQRHRHNSQGPSDREDGKLTFKDCFSGEFLEFLRQQHKMIVKDRGRLLNTCRPIEGQFIDQLALEPNWKDHLVFALGPLHPIVTSDETKPRPRHECIDWLDKQPERSVIYVSFGTTTSLAGEQIAELAKGLLSSRQRFIWVLREADRGDIYAPATGEKHNNDDGIEMIVEDCEEEGRGMVIRGWAPQVEILAHKATAGFMSHCGWNSCMESMSMGVPLLTWPMHSDQPWNAVLVTDVLRVGVVVREWRQRSELLTAGAIRGSIARLMAGGEAVMRRAKEVGEVIRGCGRSRQELENFIAHISR